MIGKKPKRVKPKGCRGIARLILVVFFVAGTLSLVSVQVHAEIISRDGPLLTVRETAQASLGEGTKAGVKEKARLAAIRKAIEENVGVMITAQSSMKNFALTEDVVSSFARVYIKSIREISYSYDSGTEKGIYTGEFVIDTSSLAKMAEAERALAANRNKPVEASVFLFDGGGKMMRDGSTVREGDRFNVMVQPVTKLFAYVINRDSKGNLFNIFPNARVSRHRNPLQAGAKYYFPPRESELIFSFDGNPGEERFHILLSAVPMPDMDALFATLAGLNGADRGALAPIVQERIASRGIVLESRPIEAELVAPNSRDRKMEKRIGELLKGSGALVRTIRLRHVR